MTTENTSVITFKTPLAELANIEAIAGQCSLQMTNAQGNFQRALTMAAGIRMLRKAISPEIMGGIMELCGTKLGFRTDLDSKPQGYAVEIVKECVIEHVLRGGMIVGNEMNIIAGNAYQTKEFFSRMLAEHPGLTDLQLFPGVPVMSSERGALVAYSATWKLHGQAMRIDRKQTKLDDGSILDERLSIRVNSGMGPDAVLGKAERKIKAAIYARITGTIITDADVTDGEAPRRPVANLDDLTDRLQGTDANGVKPGEKMDATGEITKADDQIDPLDGIAEQFAACELKGDARKLYDSLCGPDAETELADGPRALVTEWFEKANARIEGSRGSRSNKQPSLAGTT